MKERFAAVSRQLNELGIQPQSKFVAEREDKLIQHATQLDQLQHAAYEAIEEHYSQFNPAASKEEHFHFFKKILRIKNVLRELQNLHNDLTQKLGERSMIYIQDEQKINLNDKIILPELKGKEPKEIVRANFYQLLENITRNNSLNSAETNYITSLLMQLVSRPAGIKLIVKLNYLLASKDAQLILKPSKNFECSMTAEGLASASPEFTSKSFSPEDDFKTILKKATIRGRGAQRVRVGIDFNYNNSISALNLETYASTGNGLTDSGPAFVLMGHELIHAMHNLLGKARHNFSLFFQGNNYQDDPLMNALYPTSSLYSYGSAAEEYWTIEGAVLCENSIRNEHGFFRRTGHISAEPGSRAIRDLYYIGLARSYDLLHLERLQTYIQNQEEIDDISKDDLALEKLLQCEKYKLMHYSFTDIISMCQFISPLQLRRMERVIKSVSREKMENEERDLEQVLAIIPPKIAQLFVAVTTRGIAADEKIDSEELEAILPSIKRMEELLKESGLSHRNLKVFSNFIEAIEQSATHSALKNN
ncbi:hypothetical protein OQJ15_15235 [Fluoribacter dumoffii]|uniref:Uncharacterized protein n=1 Tax=Fluoribacter dumoffii TaxID=463 RepID=A0A377GDG5_9GAMM|nr:hypothetical protein [Fluoribacter dumoffii]MCW8387661.1 hypothetical protein [Fluoribacter dumoffii]MCW8497864.1 hypothetical protein [Fluoribacter dumoffii]STO22866.1 Uncharacterised protein [Fluoribacter dumoffii]